MLEQAYTLSQANEKTIEKVLLDENLHYLHIVLPHGEELPVHNTNATMYMTVVRGRLSISLAEQETHVYDAGTMIKIPLDTKMHARNLHAQTLELILVKSPAPRA